VREHRGATSSFYTPVAADAGPPAHPGDRDETRRLAAQNSESSAPVIACREARVTPQILGGTSWTRRVADGGNWDGSTPITFTYSWRRCNPVGDPRPAPDFRGDDQHLHADRAGHRLLDPWWITGTNLAGSDLAITNHTFPIVDKQHFGRRSRLRVMSAGSGKTGRQLTTDRRPYQSCVRPQSTDV